MGPIHPKTDERKITMQFNHLSFPIRLDTWRIQSQGHDLEAYYYDWDNSSNNEPHPGGHGWVVIQGYDDGHITNWWNILLVAPGQFALKPNDNNNAYAGRKNNGQLGLTDGPSDDSRPFRTYDPNGRFTLENLGWGKVAIRFKNQPLSVNCKDHGDMKTTRFIDGSVQSWETFTVAQGSHFTTLLLSQSGMELNLSGQNLADGGYLASVAGTDFSNANLSKATFASLPDPSLAGCNFSKANLTGTELRHCRDLNKANWNGANLSGVNLSQVDPSGTTGVNFSNAVLEGAILSNGNPPDRNHRYESAKFIHTNLRGANLSNISFKNSDFTGASLAGAKLDGADLTGCNLTETDLTGASLKGTNLTGAHFPRTKFAGCDLSTTTFSPSPDFGRLETTRTSFAKARNLPVPKLGPDWSFLDLTDAKLTMIPAALTNLKAVSTLFPNQLNFKGIALVGANLKKARLYYADLSNADLADAVLDGALLKGANLSRANLAGTSLKQAWLIAEEHTTDPNKYEAAKVSEAFMINAVLDEAHCDGVDFSGVLFLADPATSSRPASADKALLNRANFADANVIGVSFRGAQLAGTNFSNGVLVHSSFPSARITPTSDQVHSVPSMHNADIRGTQFADCTHNGITNPANMDGLEMSEAVFSTSAGRFEKVFTDFHGNQIPVSVDFGATVLGTTTASTICPNGNNGPCSL